MIIPIKSWNVFMLSNNPNNIKPSVYVTLTDELKKLLEERGNIFNNLKIYGTGTVYDNKEYDSVAYNSLNTPNFRPNFFMKNNIIIFVLDYLWYGYPDPNNLGYITI